MKKLGRVLLLCSIINIFSFNVKKPHLEVKADAPTSSLSWSGQLFLPMVLRQELQGYFVSPNGSDTNPGSFLQPWKTIRKAARMVSPGDTVYIRRGVYNESVTFETSGTEANPIRIMAYPGENPIIDGGFYESWGILLQIRGDYNYISGLEIRNSDGQGIYLTGNYDVIDNVYVHHCMAAGIFVSHGQHSIVQNSRVWMTSLMNEYGHGNNWANGLAVARYGVSYVTIRHNIVWESWGEGIASFEADHITIEDNITHDNYSTNIYISDSTNVLCQRNFVYTDPRSYVFPYGAHGGIMMGDERYTPASANITVINNISFGNQGNYWWWQGLQGGGMNNVLIANNTFINGIGNLSDGRGGVIISRGDHKNVRFENNLVQQDGNLPVIATVSQPGVTYSHNLWSKPPYNAASGSGDIIANPLLAHTGDPFSPDWFRLSGSSPAINHALSLPEVLYDFFSLIRDSNPDMGAIEFFP